MFKYCTKYVSRGCKLQCVVQFNLWIRNTMVSIWQLTRAFSNHSWILFGLEPFISFPWDGTLIYILHWDGTLLIPFFIGTEPFYIISLGTEPFLYPFHWDGTLIYIFHWDGTLLISFFIGTEPFLYISFWLSLPVTIYGLQV